MSHLFHWQEQCLAAWEQQQRRGIVNAITGSGKTRLAIAAIESTRRIYPDLKVKIVVPTLPLAKQWAAAISSVAVDSSRKSLQTGFFHGGQKDDPSLPCMIYVVNSARYHLSRHILKDFADGHPILLIADECHHYGSGENRKIFDFLRHMNPQQDRYFSLGLSATPFSVENRPVLEAAIGREFYQYDVEAALADEIISPFAVFQISLSFTADELDEYAALSDAMAKLYAQLVQDYPFLNELPDHRFFAAIRSLVEDDEPGSDDPAHQYLSLAYRRKEVSIEAKSRLACAFQLISLLPPSDRILIFSERIVQAEKLHRQLNHAGIRAGLYHSKMTIDARRTAMQNYRNHETRILASCKALDEGINVPDASVAIVLSATSVKRQRIQRLGRILRQSSGKDIAVLYYLYLDASSDDCAYLAGQEGFPISHLGYLANEDEFVFPAYLDASAKMLETAARKPRIEDRQLEEMKRCLLEGTVRADRLLPGKICRMNRLNAATRHEKNYWICMEKLRDYFS